VARGGVAVAANVELDPVRLSTSRFGATMAPNRELDERAASRSRFAATMAANCKLADRGPFSWTSPAMGLGPGRGWIRRGGTFLICSFWLVSALSEIGEADQARELRERLLAPASPLALYAEELEARTGRHLGNYP
jgi:hypothetical protein